jgi:hypothetical protein
MITEKDRTQTNLKIFPDFQDDLASLWKDDVQTEDGKQEQKRDWSIYLKSPAPDWTGQLWKGLR